MTRLTIAAAALSLLACEVQAFELERVDDNPCGVSANLFWDSARAPVDAGALDPGEFQDLADLARTRWNEATGRFRFETGNGGFCELNDGVVALGFATTSCGGAPLGDAAAVTVTRFNVETGELLDANIVFDAEEPLLGNNALFLEIAMHELGHVLGLDHSDACGQPGAGTLMKADLSLREPRFDHPQTDDVAGVNFIYSASGGGSPALSASSCALRPSPPDRGGVPALAALALLLAARQRRPRPQRRAHNRA